MNRTVTMSSIGASQPIYLDTVVGGPVSATVVSGSTAYTSDYSLQYTLDDIMASSSPHWITSSDATALTNNSSVAFTFAAPVQAIRLASTTLSSGPSNSRALHVTQPAWG